MTNLYELLGVPKDATASQIKTAYKARARTHHPDKGGDPEKFQKIKHAYDVLRDDVRRARYDSTGDAEETQPNNELGILYAEIGIVISAVLDEATKKGLDYEAFDVLEIAIREFEGRIDQIIPQIERMERTRDGFAKVAARIEPRVEGQPNTLRMIIDGRLSTANQLIEKFERDKSIQEKAIAILKAHRYFFEQPHQFGMPWNLTVNPFINGNPT